jgi:NADPH:quinone reductase-like Zn-dependent oxidoreductase
MTAAVQTRYALPDVLQLKDVAKPVPDGDEVFGDLSKGNWGGFAQYVCAREDELTLKPAGMTFEQAAV